MNKTSARLRFGAAGQFCTLLNFQRLKRLRRVGIDSLKVPRQLVEHLIKCRQIVRVYPLVGTAFHVGHNGPHAGGAVMACVGQQ